MASSEDRIREEEKGKGQIIKRETEIPEERDTRFK